MEDILGKPIAVGQLVIYGKGQSKTLLKGTIEKVRAKTVLIKSEREVSKEISRLPKEIVVVEY